MRFWMFRVSSSRILFTILSVFNGLPTGFGNSNFNASIRDYALQDGNNSSQVRTLQKGRNAPFPGGFVPTHNSIQFKEVPDNALSSSSHSRGLAHQDHGGYVPQDYEDVASQFDHGGSYQHRDFGLYDHGYNGYVGHGHGHLGHHGIGFGYGGHHHKHYDHGLSAKFLLPVAGLALLGAAAALVSNPVLLQLGVVSGRRRRDTSEVTSGLDFDLDVLKHWRPKPVDREDHIIRRLDQDERMKDRITNSKLQGQYKGGSHKIVRIEDLILHGSAKNEGDRRDLKRQYQGLQNKKLLLKRLPLKQSSFETVTLDAQTDDIFDDGFVPVALKWKKNNN